MLAWHIWKYLKRQEGITVYLHAEALNQLSCNKPCLREINLLTFMKLFIHTSRSFFRGSHLSVDRVMTPLITLVERTFHILGWSLSGLTWSKLQQNCSASLLRILLWHEAGSTKDLLGLQGRTLKIASHDLCFLTANWEVKKQLFALHLLVTSRL